MSILYKLQLHTVLISPRHICLYATAWSDNLETLLQLILQTLHSILVETEMVEMMQQYSTWQYWHPHPTIIHQEHSDNAILFTDVYLDFRPQQITYMHSICAVCNL